MSLRKCIDTHVHLWTLSDFNYDWPTCDMKIYKNYTIDDYKKDRNKLIEKKNLLISGIIFVQVLATEDETKKIINLSKNDDLIKGIVGWVDLTNENVDLNIKQLKYEANGKLVGIRHILEGEDPDWIISKSVKNGLKAVFDNQLTYDLLLRPHILKHAIELAVEYPNMTFIIDHISKPRMNSDKFDAQWANDLKEVSKFKNIYCKLSGLVTESPNNWSIEHIEPYLLHTLECFGWERCMFGCDWPVFELIDNCDIEYIYELINTIIHKKYSNYENYNQILNSIFFDNAIKIYKLKNID